MACPSLHTRSISPREPRSFAHFDSWSSRVTAPPPITDPVPFAGEVYGTPETLGLETDRRYIHSGGTYCDYDEFGELICTISSNTEYPSAPFASFNDDVWGGPGGWARQSSTVSTSGFSGDGSATGASAGEYGNAEGTSRFDVTFTVDDFTNLKFAGLIGGGTGTEARARLYWGSTLIFSEWAGWGSSWNFDYRTTVPAGTYRAQVWADGGFDSEYGNYDFVLLADPAASEVPVLSMPTLGALCSCIVASVVGLRARRRLTGRA